MDKFKNYSVLVVDDDTDTLECMNEYLELHFSQVYKAKDTTIAYKIVLAKKPDIIFTDIKMPKNDGFSLIEKLQSQDIHIPTIIISAYDDKDKLLKAIKTDIIDYIIKPLDSKKLEQAIELCHKKLKLISKEIHLKDNFIWNKNRSILYKNGKMIKLSYSETKLMQILIDNINTPVNSEDIYFYIWDYEDKEYNSKAIRNIIYKLRKKFNSEDLITNIYGSKYMINGK